MTQELFMENYGELVQNTLVKSQVVKAEEEMLKRLKEKLQTNLENAGLDRIDYATGLVLAGIFRKSRKSEKGVLESRAAFDWPLTISSGARCPPVNRDAGGVPDSCHLTGEAFDGYFAGHMNAAVIEAMADFAVNQGFGVIRYPDELFCHFQIPLRNSIVY
nr:D-Ala-D-Ala carboxypeptidase family metallohydrolase [uncultured Acetobacterium sp.]